MKRNAKKFIAAGLIMAVTLSSVFAKPKDKKAKGKAKEVNVGYVDVTGSGIITDVKGIARDQGYFDEEFSKIGVKLNLVPMTGAGPAINEALAGGSLDIGELGDVPAVLGKANGVDTILIATGGLLNGASVIAGKGTPYKSLKDLKGKTIATQRGAFMHRTLATLLADEGLTFDDIQFVNVNAQTAAEMLVTGNVDAAVVGGVTLTRLYEQGYNIVIDYRDNRGGVSGGGTIARRKFVEQNPDVIKAYLTAIARATKYAQENRNELKDLWQSVGESGESYEYLYPNHDNYPDIVAKPESLQNLKDTLSFLLEYDLITKDRNFSVDDWYDGTYAEYAVAEAAKK
ncbi:MAG: ABC transporter substrate-binding protein [Treponema sp.]|nr:ABC transporter substrate-binding protein [Treponema sp.]